MRWYSWLDVRHLCGANMLANGGELRNAATSYETPAQELTNVHKNKQTVKRRRKQLTQ